jgi:serine/threonine protein kinase
LLLQGIIHRDIKPDNIGVQPDLTVKLFDWGEALLVNELHSLTDRQLIKAARVAGTPLFMPPEVLLYLTRKGADSSSSSSSASSSRGSSSSSNGSDDTAGSSANASSSRGLQERQHTRTAAAGCSCWGGLGSAKLLQQAAALHELASTKVDIWGLGTVVYFLLAGRDILQDDSGYDLEDMADIVSASGGIQLPKTAQASPAARDFLARALERDPAKRACAAELLQHPWLAGLASAAHLKPLLSLSARSSEGQGTAYVIAAHRGLLQGAAASVPDTPVSGSTELLSDISEYE